MVCVFVSVMACVCDSDGDYVCVIVHRMCNSVCACVRVCARVCACVLLVEKLEI